MYNYGTCSPPKKKKTQKKKNQTKRPYNELGCPSFKTFLIFYLGSLCVRTVVRKTTANKQQQQNPGLLSSMSSLKVTVRATSI